MIYLFITAWLWWNTELPINQISRTNQARREAETAYRAGQYNRALTLYTYLSRTTTTIDPAVRLNLGHTYFQLHLFERQNRSTKRCFAPTDLICAPLPLLN